VGGALTTGLEPTELLELELETDDELVLDEVAGVLVTTAVLVVFGFGLGLTAGRRRLGTEAIARGWVTGTEWTRALVAAAAWGVTTWEDFFFVASPIPSAATNARATSPIASQSWRRAAGFCVPAVVPTAALAPSTVPPMAVDVSSHDTPSAAGLKRYPTHMP
jgi:hypothetical protein